MRGDGGRSRDCPRERRERPDIFFGGICAEVLNNKKNALKPYDSGHSQRPERSREVLDPFWTCEGRIGLYSSGVRKEQVRELRR